MRDVKKDFAEIKNMISDGLSLLRSEEWTVYVRFLRERAVKLQDDVNDAVRRGDIVKAQICLAVLEDSVNQCHIFKKQIKELKEKHKELSNV